MTVPSTKLSTAVAHVPPVRTLRRRLGWLSGAALAIVVSGCAHNAPQDSLRPAGTESKFIDNLFVPVFWIAVAIFCLVAGLVVTFCIKYRARGEDDRPRQVHGSTRIEIAWTIVPALLLIGVGAASVTGVFHLYRVPKGAPVTVQATSATSGTITGDVLHVNVIAHRWWFEYRYPGMGPNGKDLVTANELFIPVRRQVYLDITSNEPLGSPENATGHGIGDGVIHNFWVPRLAGKIYAIPGIHNHLILNAYAAGTYFGQCSEFCGISHANMRIRAVALNPDDFAAWAVNQQQLAKVYTAADQFTNPSVYAGFTLFKSTCTGCHTINGVSEKAAVGPNLTHLQTRTCFAGCILPITDANLRLWLRNPQAVKPGANMIIPTKLTEDQITSIIAYLDTLK